LLCLVFTRLWIKEKEAIEKSFDDESKYKKIAIEKSFDDETKYKKIAIEKSLDDETKYKKIFEMIDEG